jgi:hypothetical protein
MVGFRLFFWVAVDALGYFQKSYMAAIPSFL